MAGVRLPINSDAAAQVIREEAQAELLALAAELEGEMKRTLRDNNSIFTGNLEGSIAAVPVTNAGAGAVVQVGTPVEYGTYLEFGTKPHWVPFEPLRRWVEGKIQPHVLAVGVSFEGGKVTPTRKGTRRLRGDARERAVVSMARAIQRSIARKGTKAHPFMSTSLDKLGVPYRVRQGEEIVYEVDVMGWLKSRGTTLWQRIAARLGTS